MFAIPRKPLYQHVSQNSTRSTDLPLQASLAATHKPVVYSTEQHGRPIQKSRINSLDLVAVLLSIICLVLAIVVINPAGRYSFRLGTNNQIIVLGFLLGIINQCLLRIVPYSLILLEAQYGQSTLQNYDGLLRWSPFVSKLNILWRGVLVVLTLMPLALGVSYKQFTGGVAQAGLPPRDALYGPTGPPGLQGNIGTNAVMANSTAPFISATTDDVEVPDDISSNPQVFGFNLILLSKTSAAAIDGPHPARVAALQRSLTHQSSMTLTANVRGTVARRNPILGDMEYWSQTYNLTGGLSVLPLWNDYDFVLVQQGVAFDDSARSWNGSWALVANMQSPVVQHSASSTIKNILEAATRFDVLRHACTATWKLTYNSIELVSGRCDPKPLEDIHQYYYNAQISLGDQLGRSLAESIGPFITFRNQSQWRMPTYAATIASAYQSISASSHGYIPVQPGGPFWTEPGVVEDCSSYKHDAGPCYVEAYTSNEIIRRQVPILRNSWGLYIVLALQPVMTVLAFTAVVCMFHIPVGRTFSLISVMAGVNRDTLDLLTGASFSGELRRPLGLEISLAPVPCLPTEFNRSEGLRERVKYDLGRRGVNGTVKGWKEYE